MYKVSAISYLNTVPFLYGLKKTGFISSVELSIDTPAACAKKLLTGAADIGIVPVAILPELKHPHIITDYCIGARGAVKSVILASNTSVNKIRKVYLDYQSRSSVMLVQVLAYHHWKIKPEFVHSQSDEQLLKLKENEAAVIIGDRALQHYSSFAHVYDLAAEWMAFSGLPFVFACWVGNKKIDPEFVKSFNQALKAGVDNIDEVVRSLDVSKYPETDFHHYFTKNVDYQLDDDMRQGMNLFLKYLTS